MTRNESAFGAFRACALVRKYWQDWSKKFRQERKVLTQNFLCCHHVFVIAEYALSYQNTSYGLLNIIVL